MMIFLMKILVLLFIGFNESRQSTISRFVSIIYKLNNFSMNDIAGTISITDSIRDEMYSLCGNIRLDYDLSNVSRSTLEKLKDLSVENLMKNDGKYWNRYSPINYKDAFESNDKFTIYDTSDVERYLSYRITDAKDAIISLNKEIVVIIPNKQDVVDLLKECLLELGYSESARRYCNDYQFGEFLSISFVPMWKKPLDKTTVKYYEELWFITPYENIKQIKKYGVIPRTSIDNNIGEYVIGDKNKKFYWNSHKMIMHMHYKDFGKHRYYLCVKINLDKVDPQTIYVEPTPYGTKVCMNYRIFETQFADDYIVFDCEKDKEIHKWWKPFRHIKTKIGPVWPLWK